MKRITAGNFKDAIKLDPAWAAKLTEPVEITGYCSMPRSPITHLSPLLRFLGRNPKGYCASFHLCSALKVAEGNFAGFINFSRSGIEKIGSLKIKRPSRYGWAASFDQCEHLRVATGTYPGSVTFRNSAIESIYQLIVSQPDTDGDAASFLSCTKLMVAEGSFAGFVNFAESGVTKIGNLVISHANPGGMAANFPNCIHLKVAEGSFPGRVSFRNSGISRIEGLSVTPDLSGKSAYFGGCVNIRQVPKGWLDDAQYEIDPATRDRIALAQKVRMTAQSMPDLEF